MNLNTTPPTDFSSLNDFTNSTLASFQNTTFNQTAALLMAVNNSSYTWDMKYYWIIAVSLLCTIPLSIAAGGVLRWSIQFAAKNVVHWRVIVILVGISIIGVLYGILPLLVDEGNYASLMTQMGILGIYSLWRLYRAFRIGRARRIWAGFLLALSVSIAASFIFYIKAHHATSIYSNFDDPTPVPTDEQNQYPSHGLSQEIVDNAADMKSWKGITSILPMLIPWIYLLLIWLGPDIKRWWRNIRKRKAQYEIVN